MVGSSRCRIDAKHRLVYEYLGQLIEFHCRRNKLAGKVEDASRCLLISPGSSAESKHAIRILV